MGWCNYNLKERVPRHSELSDGAPIDIYGAPNYKSFLLMIMFTALFPGSPRCNVIRLYIYMYISHFDNREFINYACSEQANMYHTVQ